MDLEPIHLPLPWHCSTIAIFMNHLQETAFPRKIWADAISLYIT